MHTFQLISFSFYDTKNLQITMHIITPTLIVVLPDILLLMRKMVAFMYLFYLLGR